MWRNDDPRKVVMESETIVICDTGDEQVVWSTALNLRDANGDHFVWCGGHSEDLYSKDPWPETWFWSLWPK